MAIHTSTTKNGLKSKAVTTAKANIKNDVTSLKDSNNKSRTKLAKAAEIRAAKALAAKPKPNSKTDDIGSNIESSYRSGAFRWFRKSRGTTRPIDQEKPSVQLPSVWRISRIVLRILKSNWKLFLGIIAIHAILTILLVRGLSDAGNINSLKQIFGGDLGRVTESLIIFVSLISNSSSNPNPVAGLYQSILAIVTSLAIIWGLRQVFAADEHIRIRDAFYKGMYPLVPIVLILVVISLQLIPFLLGANIYGTIQGAGLATNIFEQSMWALLFFLLALLSVYMISSSIFALYIAALPDMTPVKALRTARGLVQFRRWTIMRKLLFLPLMIFVIAAIIMIPVIMISSSIAPLVFFLLTMLMLPFVHTYIYTLYRELLV